MLSDAATATIADAVIGMGIAMTTGMLGGNWEPLDAARALELHVLHGALGVLSGAADELEYYGGGADTASTPEIGPRGAQPRESAREDEAGGGW